MTMDDQINPVVGGDDTATTSAPVDTTPAEGEVTENVTPEAGEATPVA